MQWKFQSSGEEAPTVHKSAVCRYLLVWRRFVVETEVLSVVRRSSVWSHRHCPTPYCRFFTCLKETTEKTAEQSVVEAARALRERFNQNEIQQLIQELVSSKTDVASSNTLVSTGMSRLEPKRLAVVGDCPFACVCPALSSTLPDELVQLVFARLPLPKVNELRSLSSQWNESFFSEESSEFMRACTKAGPKIFGMVTQTDNIEWITVRLFDTNANRWYSYVDKMANENLVTMCAGDGGLVCFVSTSLNKSKEPLVIFVFYPLTRQCRTLQPHALSKVQPRMVQLVMDEETGFYKVILVGKEKQHEGRGTRVVAEVYSSETGEWSTAEAFPELCVFGYRYSQWRKMYSTDDWPYPLEETCFGPCAYDFARHELLKFKLVEFVFQDNPVYTFERLPCVSYALLTDRLFVLHRKLHESSERDGDLYVISEYQYHGGSREPSWVKLRVHEGGQFEHAAKSERYNMQLYACRGFLLLKPTSWEDSSVYATKLAWLYDLSTTKWRKVPAIPHPGCYDDVMFELGWDAP